MGTTPKGLPYPEPTGKVGAGDDDIKALALAVDGLVDDVTPIESGGTGATTAANARANLGAIGVGQAVINDSYGVNTLYLQWVSGRMVMKVDGTDQGQIARVTDVLGRVDKNGDTMSGPLYLPNAFGASSGYTVAYINGDGRVSRGTSSERFKEHVRDAGDLGDLFAVPVVEFEWIDGDGKAHIGYIAERFAETPQLERFVVYDDDGAVTAIDWIELLIAQNAQLNARLRVLEQNGDR